MNGKRWMMVLLSAVVLGSAFSAVAGAEPEAVVKKVYREVLGRDPDPSGMRTFRSHIIDDGWSEKDVRNALLESDEYKKQRAAIIVRRAYEDILGRKPDARGMAEWVKKIEEDNWSEKKVREALRDSAEYRAKNKD